ncbi:MAG: hypothetical protein WAK20_17300 [Candidatus Acidiferrum sp.]
MSYAVQLSEQVSKLTPQGSLEFNEWFLSTLEELGERVARVLQDELIAVVLGGGYGRGEGGITLESGIELPYNDVDLFLVTKTPTPKNTECLHRLAVEYKGILHASVDFSRPQTISMIRSWPCSLKWQELTMGHRVLYGPKDIIDSNVRGNVSGPLPLIEASRLLINRGAGLVWAQRVLEGLETCPDTTFVARNYFKCVLGVADAVLISHGLYSSDLETKLCRISSLCARHDGFAYKIRADKLMNAGITFRRALYKNYGVGDEDCRRLASRWLKSFLWVESQRFGRGFSTVEDYAAYHGPRESHKFGVIGNIASNGRRGRWSWRHPREQVYFSLPETMKDLQDNSHTFPDSSHGSLELWRRAQ